MTKTRLDKTYTCDLQWTFRLSLCLNYFCHSEALSMSLRLSKRNTIKVILYSLMAWLKNWHKIVLWILSIPVFLLCIQHYLNSFVPQWQPLILTLFLDVLTSAKLGLILQTNLSHCYMYVKPQWFHSVYWSVIFVV